MTIKKGFNMHPFFSVVIPIYNVAPYLRETLDSVCKQTFTDWECCCVDDGSTDGSETIIDEYAARDFRIKVVHKENGGVSSARNVGIDRANGEWMMFLDSDDLLEQNALEKISENIHKSPGIDLFKFGFRRFDESGLLPSPDGRSDKWRKVDISHRIEFDDVFVYMWQWAYRRSMLGDLRFNLTYHRMEDRPFICDCLFNRCDAFVDIGENLLLYRQRQGSAMHVKPSAIVWSGEIRYRIELLQMLDASGKIVPNFAASNWIGGFYANRCIHGILGRNKHDVKSLLYEWFVALRFLSRRSDLPKKWRICFGLVGWTHSYVLSLLFFWLVRYLRYECPMLKPLARFYRKIRHHGEFATNATSMVSGRQGILCK